MNKNKILFAIIWLLLFIVVMIWVSSLNSWDDNTDNSANQKNIDKFAIWIVWDDKEKFQDFLYTFKEKNPRYENTNIVIESFPDYNEYYYTLIWAFLKWTAPDMFVLNNNEESSIFDEQIAFVDPQIFDPDELSRDFEPVFTNNLIRSTQVWWWDDWPIDLDYVRWIPMWYETLWMYYSFRKFKWKDLVTWAWLNDAVSNLSSDDDNFSPLWIWDWSTVINAFDIITSIFVQNWANAITNWINDSIKQALFTYINYWSTKSDNKYNLLISDALKNWYTNLDLFTRDKVWLIFWYPRMILDIDKKWFNKKFLRVSPFPQNTMWDWVILVNYNYYVMNKFSPNISLSKDLMIYFSSESWEKEFLKRYPYYLPAHLSLLSRRLEEKIHPDYWIELWNFYNDKALLVSFDKKNKVMYDTEIIWVLDSDKHYVDIFNLFSTKLYCKYNKMINQKWLSKNCN